MSKPLHVVCIGDSITSGGACQAESYVDELRTLLGPAFTVMNEGVRGRTLLKEGLLTGHSGGSYWNTPNWQRVVNSNADVFTIMLGTNDAKIFNWFGVQHEAGDFYALDYVDMVQQLRAKQPAAKIFVLIPPPVFADLHFQINATVVNHILPKTLRRVATVMNLPIIDINVAVRSAISNLAKDSHLSEESAAQAFSCDNIHPTIVMNKVMAVHILEHINSSVMAAT
jgi:lysophospholipase L1-like esterase